MRNECNIIRDLLPLYWEGMVSEDTEAYVKEHLEGCAECARLNAQTEPEEAEPVPIEEIPAADPDIMALKKVKKKIQKKRIIAIVISVILTTAVIFACVDFTPTKIDYGNSQIYSRQEMEEAVKVIKKDYRSRGYKLYSITYQGDNESRRELNGLKNNKHYEYAYCMVFRGSYRTPFFACSPVEPNTVEECTWVLVRTYYGEWEIINRGYA